ncbi:MAG TPA: alpha/beta hydrolase [Anaerolineales bacterium]|nr:alpha/beta hydrolase [Anaerolineales bacterium]
MAAGKYANVNGLNMYYEVYGKGQPLLLLHGGFGTISMFDAILPTLAENRQAIGVEWQGHGHTADIDRPFSFEQLADDVAALINHLKLENADLLGYSLGGGVALQTAIRHPDLIRRLVVVSAPCKSDGWYAEVHAGQKSIHAESAKAWVGSPMHQAYVSVAPKPDDWIQFVAKASRMVGQDYDWSKDPASIKAPMMIAVGDADAVRPAHAVEFFELRGGGQREAGWDRSGMPNARLAILPGITHYDIITSPALAEAVISFLDAPMPERNRP